MSFTFYNYEGRAIAYTDDGETIYLYTGEPVAYIYDDSIYTFDGYHIGWIGEGWIRDHDGNAAFFSERATGGPLKPLKQLKPLKGVKRIKQVKYVRRIKPIKPYSKFTWSELSDESFFEVT